MRIFITDQQKSGLERFHDSSSDKRVCDRIKAILLASEGWISVMSKYKTTITPSGKTGWGRRLAEAVCSSPD